MPSSDVRDRLLVTPRSPLGYLCLALATMAVACGGDPEERDRDAAPDVAAPDASPASDGSSGAPCEGLAEPECLARQDCQPEYMEVFDPAPAQVYGGCVVFESVCTPGWRVDTDPATRCGFDWAPPDCSDGMAPEYGSRTGGAGDRICAEQCVPIGQCQRVNCAGPVSCGTLTLAPPDCAEGEAAEIADRCWGTCVPAALCVYDDCPTDAVLDSSGVCRDSDDLVYSAFCCRR